MENFSRLAAFDYSPLPHDSDESLNPPTYLDRLVQADPDEYRHEPTVSTTDGHPEVRSSVYDGDTRSSVDSWSSGFSRQSTPFSTIDDVDFSSTSGFDSRSSTSEPQDDETTVDNQLYNANGKRNNSTSSDVTATKKRKTVTGNYTRHVDKPPYRYLGLIIYAIHSSPGKALILGSIHSWFRQNFEFFRGKYTGWKDSVRHTLSSSRCFYKETRDPLPGQIKKPQNYWKVDLSMVTDDVFRLQENQLGKTGHFAPTIHEELGIPPIQLPPKSDATKETKVQKSKTTKKRRSGDKANVKLPKKFQKQNKSVTESPEVLRHSSSTDQKADTPTHAQKTSDVNSSETPTLSEVLGYDTDTPSRKAVNDAVQNLSLLCDPSQTPVDLNTSFLGREEDMCPDMSPAPRVNSATGNSSVNSHIGSAFSRYQRPATGFDERVKSEPSYPAFHQEPVFQRHYPVVCHFQTPSTPTYYSESSVSPFVPVVSTCSYTPFVPIVSSYTPDPVFSSVLHSGHEGVIRPRSVSPDEPFMDIPT